MMQNNLQKLEEIYTNNMIIIDRYTFKSIASLSDKFMLDSREHFYCFDSFSFLLSLFER